MNYFSIDHCNFLSLSYSADKWDVDKNVCQAVVEVTGASEAGWLVSRQVFAVKYLTNAPV